MQAIEPSRRTGGGRLGWPAITGLALAHWVAIALWGQALNAMNGVPWDARLLPGEVMTTLASVAISVAVYAVIRAGRALSKRAWPWVAAGAALGGAALATAAGALVANIAPMLRPDGAFGLVRLVWETLFILTPFALWSLIVMVVESGRLVREREARLAGALVAAREAEIRALHYQVNPHFLYNALNSISTLILDGRPAEADRMVMALAAFFRANLTADPLVDVKLAEEVAQQRLYLAIEEARYPGRLKVKVDVPDGLADALAPTLILQPLVENAVKYGVARSNAPVTIEIKASAEGGRLRLTVSDDGGDGVGSSVPPKLGLGLENVRRRLDLIYGKAAELTCGPRRPNGFLASVEIPLERA